MRFSADEARDKPSLVLHITFMGQFPPRRILASWCGKKVVPDKIKRRTGWDDIPAVRHDRVVEIKSPLILQPGPAALTDGLDAIVAALWP